MHGHDDEFDDMPAEEPVTAEAAEPSSERVWTDADVKAKVDAATLEAKDRHLRVLAEYDNFRRRVQREKEQWTTEAVERFTSDLLPVLDDFDRALSVKTDSAKTVLEGIRLTDKQLRAALAKHGVEVIDPAGQKFDPKLHEAIQRVPPGEQTPPGTVVSVFEKGYSLNGRLLRPARVQVAGDA
jgi:molecular chaperone GrpE